MCWSGEASAVLATAGLGTTAYAAYRKEPAAIWMPLGYFSLMELLQAFTYSVIDQCSLPSNQIATLLGYLHIAFQPFFINAVSMHFIPDQARARQHEAIALAHELAHHPSLANTQAWAAVFYALCRDAHARRSRRRCCVGDRAGLHVFHPNLRHRFIRQPHRLIRIALVRYRGLSRISHQRSQPRLRRVDRP